jgi:two-component system response regulator AlgR
MSNLRVLIVDDEPLARARLRKQVAAIEGYEVVGEAESGLQALEMVSKSGADILLLDIRMPGMDGLEVGRHVSMSEHPPAVIFTTAYSEHALEAFQAHAVDYLLKPVREEKLRIALGAAHKLSRAQIQQVDEELQGDGRSHICARVRGDLQLIDVADIYYFKADSKYVEVRHRQGHVLIEESLVSLEQEFDAGFFRVHRNALVAKAYIDGLRKDDAGHSYVSLSGIDDSIEVSRRHLPAVRALLKH